MSEVTLKLHVAIYKTKSSTGQKTDLISYEHNHQKIIASVRYAPDYYNWFSVENFVNTSVMYMCVG